MREQRIVRNHKLPVFEMRVFSLLLIALALHVPRVLGKTFLYHSTLLRSSKNVPAPPPIVIVHGLLGSARNFQTWSRLISNKMMNEHDIVVVDLRCHGRSVVYGDLKLDFRAMAEDLIFTLHRLNIGQAHLVGHSLGGKVVALASILNGSQSNGEDKSLRILSTTLMDISPINYQGTKEFQNVLSCIDFLETSKKPISDSKSRKEAVDLVQREISEPLLSSFLISNLQSKPCGTGFEWRFMVDGIASSRNLIEDFPETDGLVCMHPVLILKGSRSNFVNSSHLSKIKQMFPMYTLATVNAGHWLHSENPEESAMKLTNFLQTVERWYKTGVGVTQQE